MAEPLVAMALQERVVETHSMVVDVLKAESVVQWVQLSVEQHLGFVLVVFCLMGVMEGSA